MNDVKQLLRKVRRQGFAVRIGGSGHYRVESPAGDVITMAATPRARGLARARADLRRTGARL